MNKPMKTFYQLLGNTIIANVTNMTIWFALVFFVYLETRSVTATSIVSGIYLVAVALSGFWFGSLVDHYKKKHLMLLSGFVSLAIYSIAFGIYLTAGPEHSRIQPASHSGFSYRCCSPA
jgi:MFS transporter, DHA3 family, multidrug efflux protein